MELSKNFEPKAIEEKWYKHWMAKRYFNSQPDERPSFTVVIPPPNVTGVLHMGHTLNETVQDILVRKARMSGFNACWVPGSDHASIATEAKVVQMLEKEKGIKKADLSREEFLKYAFEWKDKYGGIIYHQIEKLGCSVDWERVCFTMDPDYYKAVIKVFTDLYQKGLIYRGARMINWDPSAKTALSDEEVEYKDVTGKLYYVKYKMADGDGFISIATQRPETIMGDTAVCVNPDDDRYKHLKGKQVIVPLVNRAVPVIFDEYVDKEFGTGALKITPAHDINDYNIGLKHNLPTIDTLNEDGTLSEAAEVFVGLDRFEARKKAIEKLAADGLLIKEEEYTTRLGFSQRTNAVVEPRISTQWFVKMKELAEPALKEVTEGRIRIHPGDKFLATYKYWLENVKDWCISRQLWWGQRIPAYYAPDGIFAVAETKEEAFAQLKIKNEDLRIEELSQDEDVLDTWFSSWLWPIEVFKGITQPGNKDISYYYPTSVLVTGQDIIFFWVARMIMAGMEYMQEKPFADVYFTGMVRDKQGRKMSKSLGNSPDLLDLIGRFGADAVRFGIMISSPAGNDLLWDEGSNDQGRNFNNKMWNALKLVKTWEIDESIEQTKSQEEIIDWFENRYYEQLDVINNLFYEFKLSEALAVTYKLIWDDYCAWYLEAIKPEFTDGKSKPINKKTLEKTITFFENILKLLHPFMPFVTEEIWHHLKDRKDNDCISISKWPQKQSYNQHLISTFEGIKKHVATIRSIRTDKKIPQKEKIKLLVKSDPTNLAIKFDPVVIKLCNLSEIIHGSQKPANSISFVSLLTEFYIPVSTEINVDEEKNRLLKDLEYLKGFLLSVEKKLSNERFVQNAKPEVVDVERKKKADAEQKIKAIEESLANLV